jgi:hypothetical protein
MDAAEFAILALNVILGIVCGIPVARMFASSGLPGLDTRRALTRLVLVYFIECVAFMASMGTSILSIALAVLWGPLLGSRLRAIPARHLKASKLAGLFALYTSLPAASFLSVPMMCAISGRSVTSTQGGLVFGIPPFLPWPLNTILGFCTALAIGTVILKMVITICLVRRIALRSVGRSAETV